MSPARAAYALALCLALPRARWRTWDALDRLYRAARWEALRSR